MDDDEREWMPQLTLGELVSKLRQFDDYAALIIDTGAVPKYVDSYRGYYEQLAINTGGSTCSVGEFLSMLRAADGHSFEGYKGGKFRMGKNTEMWVSEYGEASGMAVVGVTERPGGLVVIETKDQYDDV